MAMTIDRNSQVTEQGSLHSILLATILIVCGAWEALALAFPELQRFDLGTAPSSLQAVAEGAFLLAPGVPVFLLMRRLAVILGHGRFFRAVMTIGGLLLVGFDLVLVWKEGLRNLAYDLNTARAFAAACLVGGAVLTTLGHPPAEARRRGSGLGCIAAAAFAVITWAKGDVEAASCAALASAACGLSYVVFANVLPGMVRTAQWQIATEWPAARNRLLGGAVALAVSIGLWIFARQNYVLGTDPSNRMSAYGATAGLVSVFVFLFAICWLWGGLARLLRSLVPSSSPNLAAVARQQVHGAAGYAAAGQVDAALRDQDHAGGDMPRFRD